MLHEDEVLKPKRFGTSGLIETFKGNDYPNEHAFYCIEHENEDILFACMYMDGLILTGNNLRLSEKFE